MSNDSENTRDDGDLIWGAANIGAEISRTEDQLLYLLKIGTLQGAVKKLAPASSSARASNCASS